MKKNILENDLPCWYELSYINDKKPLILIRAHKDFVEQSLEIPNNNVLVWSYQHELGFDDMFSSFCGSLKAEKDFGFNNALKYQGKSKDGDFAKFLINIPQVKIETTDICTECVGSGKNEILDNPCFYCHGKGKKIIYDWRNIRAVSASFTIFSRIAGFFENSDEIKETSFSKSQLLTAETETRTNIHGGGIWGKISPSLAMWLKNNREKDFSDIGRSMINAYERMMGSVGNCSIYDFRFDIGELGGIHLSCPGNACGIDYSSHNWRNNIGYEFSPHNVDTSVQQFTLLAGLAALHDMARENML